MIVETLRFGQLDVDPETILMMPEGLIGMSEINRVCLVEEDPPRPFRWLQVVGEPALAFVAVNPYDFFPEYECEVSAEDFEFLGIQEPEDAVVLVLLTFGREQPTVTANLVAPIIACSRTRTARQVILQDDRYTTRHALNSGRVPAVKVCA